VRNVQELIDGVQGLGGELALRGERIHFRLPHTPDASRLVEEMRARREEVVAALRERDKLSCGSPHCAGCYNVGDGKKIHPPRCGEAFLRWRAWLEGKGQIQ
jgi:hypothetical protein